MSKFHFIKLRYALCFYVLVILNLYIHLYRIFTKERTVAQLSKFYNYCKTLAARCFNVTDLKEHSLKIVILSLTVQKPNMKL